MAVIYTEPQYHGKRPGGHGYEHYTREVYCTCGKKIGTQTKYDGNIGENIGECHCSQWENDYFYYLTKDIDFCSYGEEK